MATLKPTVKTKLKTGMYIVYIRVVQNRQSSFIRTSWMVNDKGVKGKEVTDPFVMQQVSNLISSYYSMLNKIDSSSWTASEVVAYLTTSTEDMSFSDYARNHIEKLIRRGQERTSRNYKWALNHMERFAETDNIMFSRMTSAFLNRWIASLSETNRCKEQYPVCIREVYKAALKEFNDEEQGIARLKNPWGNVTIPRSDIPEKRAIPASMLRKFFNVVPDRSRFTNPLMEVGQDVALISFCLCGLNAVDIFNAEKDQYVTSALPSAATSVIVTCSNVGSGLFFLLIASHSIGKVTNSLAIRAHFSLKNLKGEAFLFFEKEKKEGVWSRCVLMNSIAAVSTATMPTVVTVMANWMFSARRGFLRPAI